jgi:hypothetical protein
MQPLWPAQEQEEPCANSSGLLVSTGTELWVVLEHPGTFSSAKCLQEQRLRRSPSLFGLAATPSAQVPFSFVHRQHFLKLVPGLGYGRGQALGAQCPAVGN